MSYDKSGLLSPSFPNDRKKYSIAAELCYRFAEQFDKNNVNQKELTKMNLVFKKFNHNHKIIPSLSDNKIIVCYDSSRTEYIIGVKGTDIGSSTTKSDIFADGFILISQEKYSKEFKARCSRITELINIFKKNNDRCKIHLSGHSLSGMIVYHCSLTNDFIFNNVNSVHSFNPGTGLAYVMSSLKNMTFTQDQKNKFRKKINVYHISGDKISALSNGLTNAKYYGYRLKESYISWLFYIGSLLIFPTVNTYLLLGISKTTKYHSVVNFIM